MTVWQPTSDVLIASIGRESRRRRADCWLFVEEFAAMYAADSSPAALDAAWVGLVDQFPWYAEDVLFCAAAVLDDPSRPVPRLLHDIAEQEFGGGPDMGRRWLAATYRRLRAVFDELSR